MACISNSLTLKHGLSHFCPHSASLHQSYRAGFQSLSRRRTFVSASSSFANENREYVIVGGGNAAGYAAKTFVENGMADGRLCIVSKEAYAPYERPALTKAYLFPPEKKPARLPGFHTCVGSGGERQTPEWYKEQGIETMYEDPVTSIDIEKQTLQTNSGKLVKYGTLLIATGCSIAASNLPPLLNAHVTGITPTSTTDSSDLTYRSRFLLHHPSHSLGLSGLLVLPQAFGAIYLGETFCSYISINNSSTFEVRDIIIKAEIQTERQRILLLDTSKSPVESVRAGGRYDFSAGQSTIRSHCQGLVGRNGTGKTTFLRHMAMHAIDGIPPHCQILHVEQEVVGDETTALQCVLNADIERAQVLEEEADLLEQQRVLEFLTENGKGENGPIDKDANAQRQEEIYKRLELIDAYSAEARAATILAATLNFDNYLEKWDLHHGFLGKTKDLEK